MKDSSKDLFLIVLLLVVSIIIVSILLYGIIANNNSEKNNSQENEDRLNAIFPGRFSSQTQIPEQIFLTVDNNVILKDPSGDISRMNDTYVKNAEIVRPGNSLRFNNVHEIQGELNKILANNRYPYQIDSWTVAYFWREKTTCPRFSIVVPVYNQELIIQRTLHGILNHVQQEYEIIIIVDGSTDNTLSKILDFFKQKHLPGEYKSSNSSVIVIDIKQSVFETQCDNIGFKLSSAPNILEIQADMTMTQSGFNLTLEQPLLYFNDIIGISGRCTHSKLGYNAIGFPGDIQNSNNVPWTSNNLFYLSSTVNRGPLLLDRKKLIQLNYLDDKRFAIENDEHDLFKRSWSQHGYRCGYIHINFETSLGDGSSCKPMDPVQKKILDTRREGKDKNLGKLPEFLVPHFRILDPTQNRNLLTRVFGNQIQATLIQFGNTESIHYHNANMAQMANFYHHIHFETTKLYTQHHIKDFLKTLPLDISQKQRGYYYWAWKPYIIQQTLKHAKPDEVVVYADSGLFFTNPCIFHEYYQKALKEGHVFFDLWHDIKHFCKCEAKPFLKNQSGLENTMTDASLIFLKNNEDSRVLVDQWLKLCYTPYLLSDESSQTCKNNDLFIDHRHDQTLLSIVLLNNNIHTVGKQQTNFTCHHRIRNNIQFKFFWTKLGLNPHVLSILDD
jgi:glycosyl transferase family 2